MCKDLPRINDDRYGPGDKTSRYCAIDQEGKTLFERSVPTTKKGMTQVFGALARCRIALEVGTHSPWVSRLLSGLGHEVIVANARQVKLISMSSRKDDRLDAQHTGTPGASGPAVAAADPAPQRASPNSLAADPSASGAGGSAEQFGERSARTGHSGGRAISKMRRRPSGGRAAAITTAPSASSAETVVGRSGIADGK